MQNYLWRAQVSSCLKGQLRVNKLRVNTHVRGCTNGDRHKCLGLILFFMDSHIFVTVSSDASTAHVGGVKHEVLAGYFGF